MSSSQALQQFTIYQQWDAYTTLGIGNRGNTFNIKGICRNAAGNACGWKIEGEQFVRIQRVLQQMEAEPLSRATHYLQELASVAVCQWHTDQQWTVITEWEAMLRNATGQLVVQESLGSQLERETERSESLRIQLDRERERSEILVKHVRDLEAKIKSQSPSVFEFGASGGGKFRENSVEKQPSPDVQHNALQPQFESLEKLAEELKAGIAEERDAALEQTAAALNSKHSKELETLQDKMQSRLSDKDIAFGKLQTKLEQAESLLSEKNNELSVLQTQLGEVEGLRTNLALEKSGIEGELRVQETQRSNQERKINSLQAELLKHQELLPQTLAASENAKAKKPPHSEANGPSVRNPQYFGKGESIEKNNKKGFWRRWVIGFGKKNKLLPGVKQGKQTEDDIHEFEK